MGGVRAATGLHNPSLEHFAYQSFNFCFLEVGIVIGANIHWWSVVHQGNSMVNSARRRKTNRCSKEISILR